MVRDLERDLEDAGEHAAEKEDSAQAASVADSTKTKQDAPEGERDHSS
jgi:hypothetical protein